MKNVRDTENIRSAYNVGSIFRTADAAGAAKIFLVGTTPSPLDRFGRARKDIAKVALGAELSIPWEHFDTAQELIQALKKDGAEIVAVEQAEGSVGYKAFLPEGEVAYVFGNEVGGVSREALVLADTIIEIPMKGDKESLNVAVAVGVILFANS